MKVICMNNKHYEDRLTIGLKYDVIEILRFHYKIKDNNGNMLICFKDRFSTKEIFNTMYGVAGVKGPRGDNDISTVRPNYYNDTKITPLEYIKANKLDFCEGNIIKYVTRHRKKNGKEDLIKAITYIEELIKEYEGNE